MPEKNQESRLIAKLKQMSSNDVEFFLASMLQEKNLLQFVLNSLHEGLVVLSPSLEVIFINDAAKELLNLSLKNQRSIVGRYLHDVVKSKELAKVLDKTVLEGKGLSNVEFQFFGKAVGNIVINSFRTRAAGDTGDSYVVLTFRDNQQEKQLEQERHLNAQSKTMNVLSMGLAHEIKNPLNAMKLHAQVLQREIQQKKVADLSPEKLSAIASVINDEIDRLNRVVTEFGSAVRPTSPMMELVQVSELAEKAFDLMQPEAQRRGITLRHNLDYDIPLVNVDPSQISMVIVNLLKNAFDAFEDGFCGANKTEKIVTVSTSCENDEFTIEVKDNGCGMGHDMIQRVFEPFYTTKATGTGLGLSIVARIVREHGGVISVQSVKDTGTAFKLCFPLVSSRVRLIGEQILNESSDEKNKKDKKSDFF
ncbi:GHKL domain-containing protein [Candidatus Sumerlaeota bacterium]|nr:ATP-binding protein [Candidatus Sumerlaeales bacterium]NLD61703.1 GHKL domain-containing protein [Candidatus Sumerlaeota bacterium]